MKAKMQVTGAVLDNGTLSLNMQPVCGKEPFGPLGESEDNTYARWTPTGSLTLQITNPDLTDKFRVGQKFYLDFTEAIY